VNMEFFLHRQFGLLHGDSEAPSSIPHARAQRDVPDGMAVHDRRMTRIAFRDSLARLAFP
jgi:hypothetical protein